MQRNCRLPARYQRDAAAPQTLKERNPKAQGEALRAGAALKGNAAKDLCCELREVFCSWSLCSGFATDMLGFPAEGFVP